MSRSSWDSRVILPAEEAQARSLAHKYYQPWKDVPEERIEVKPVTGGLTNRLYLCTTPGHPPQRVLVRLFGKGSDLVINRPRELEVFTYLSEHGYSPKLLCSFEGGRLEEFIESTTLYGRENQPVNQEKIAIELARFHGAAVPGDKEPILFRRLDDWLSVTLRMDWGDRAARVAELNLPRLVSEIATLKAALSRISSPVVFAHNDLLGANILQDMEGRVVFIDFEYGEYNYRGFDIANHFCEYAGFDCDYSRYPDFELQARFFRAYIRQSTGRDPDIAEMQALYREVNPFALAAHISWGMWALVMAQLSSIDFDYLAYAKLRFDEYYRRRDEFLALIDAGTGTASTTAAR